MNLSGLNTKMYLTKSLLNKIFEKELTNDEINDLVLSGKIIKRFSYYQPSEELLREFQIIPDVVYIKEDSYSRLAKHNAFILREIQEIFSGCNKDTARIIAEKYFYKKHNYYYKRDLLEESLAEGKEELKI